jgi:uncharacterized protein (DUF362 family)
MVVMSKVAKVKFTDYQSSVTKALDSIDAAKTLPDDHLIIIKPNLTNADGPPVTTNVAAAEAVYKYCRANCSAKIAIGEGCGTGTTDQAYKANGYKKLADRYDIELLDFNTCESVLVKNKNALQLKEFHMPKIVPDAFIISLPILKDHCFTKTTVAMKNMFGIAPEPFYKGSWNKSKLHSPSTHKSVVDVCLYKKPDLCVVDAVVALKGMHLSGDPVNLGLILAGLDPVATDAVASELLGHNRKKIEYLTLADGLLGDMNNIEILNG